MFETHDYDVTVCRPLRAVVDAGANIGLTAVSLAQRFPEARIIAVEPEARNFAALARNVEDYPSVVPVQAAIWPEDAEVTVYDPGIGHWGYRVAATDDPPGRRLGRVRGITIDRLMGEHALPRLDLLKMDIEGSEREVLQEPDSWIDAVDALVVELHDHVRPGCDASFVAIRQRFAHGWQRGELQYLAREGSAVVGPPA